MTARLPQPGGDHNTWGQILNDYLSVIHAANGVLKPNTVGTPQLQNNSVTAAKIADDTITDAKLHPDVRDALNAVGAGGATNLSTTATASSVTVASDTGTDATVTAATTTTAGILSAADKTKLDGIADGATANATNAQLRDRASHTGTQSIATITNLSTELAAKASTSDLTTGLAGKANTADLTSGLAVKANTADVTSGLAAKANTADLAQVATTGNYTHLSNRPTIPTALNDLSDVTTAGATNGQVLKYNGSTWAPGSDNTGGGGGSDPTDLGVTTAASTVTVTSSTGADATIPAATTSNAGVMSGADKTKLDTLNTAAAVPTGGTTGQVLAKTSNSNYATQWVDQVGGGGGAVEPGIVELDDFAGATDDDKLTAALSFAAAQSRIPWIRFPARQVNLNQGGRTPFTGMKLVGPGPGASSAKNYEVGGGVNVNHRINLQAGITTGNNSLFVGSGSIYSVTVADLNFTSNNNAQFWHQPTGTIYSAEFRSLNFYGLRHIFGNASTKALMTAVNFTGFWGCNSYDSSIGSPQFHIGGSDCSFWMGGWINIGTATLGNGGYIMRFDGLSKTNVGYIYATARNGDLGIRCTGNSAGLVFFGGSYEGQNAGDPCYGNVIRVEGGTVKFRDPWIAYGMTNPTANGGNSLGMIHVTGGQVLIDGATYERATGVAETVPLVYVSGGEVRVRNAMRSGSWTGKPRVFHAGGTVDVDDTVVLESP